MDIINDILYPQYLCSRCVTTDSRQITPGCLFFALKGEHFDGNAFARQALEQGAALSVVSDTNLKDTPGCVVVSDVLDTLQQLARHHRSQLSIPVLGITGTNGKTTTKELINTVLSRRYRTHATHGNLNNHLGVPLTLLATPPDVELLIIEMGASHPGEIEMLCSIAQPTFGLITTVGKAHLEGFGSFEGVVQTKTELYRNLQQHDGLAFVPADNDILRSHANGMRTVTYGATSIADIKGTLVGASPYMKFSFEISDTVYPVQTQLVGAYNFTNAMAAVAVGLQFNVDPFDIKEALEKYVPSNNRSEYRRTVHNELVMDCYMPTPAACP